MAAAVAGDIEAGLLAAGAEAPSATDLAAAHAVSLATAKRGLVLAQDWGLLVRIDRNRLEVATSPVPPPAVSIPLEAEPTQVSGVTLLDLVVLRKGVPFTRFSSAADPRCLEDLQRMLVGAVRRRGEIEALSEYEMDVHLAGNPQPIMTFVASPENV